jgi:putative exporter of polyketide antibiotics
MEVPEMQLHRAMSAALIGLVAAFVTFSNVLSAELSTSTLVGAGVAVAATGWVVFEVARLVSNRPEAV